MDGLEEAVRELTREITTLRDALVMAMAHPIPLQNPATSPPSTELQDYHPSVFALRSSTSEPQPKAEPATKVGTRYAYTADFELFWKVYPRHKNKLEAYKAWGKSVQLFPATAWIEAAKRYRDDPNRIASFTAHPATWLRAVDPTDDDPAPVREDGQLASIARQMGVK